MSAERSRYDYSTHLFRTQQKLNLQEETTIYQIVFNMKKIQKPDDIGKIENENERQEGYTRIGRETIDTDFNGGEQDSGGVELPIDHFGG